MSKPLAHNVFFTLNDRTDAAKAKLVQSCKKYLTAHPGTVYFACGTLVEDLTRPVNDRDFDVGLHIIFDHAPPMTPTKSRPATSNSSRRTSRPGKRCVSSIRCSTPDILVFRCRERTSHGGAKGDVSDRPSAWSNRHTHRCAGRARMANCGEYPRVSPARSGR